MDAQPYCADWLKENTGAMRYFVNLPLLGVLFAIWWLVKFRLLDDKSGLEASVAVGVGTISSWVLLAVALIGCVAAGGFDWLPLNSRVSVFAAVLGSFAVVVVLSLASIGIAMEAADAGRQWSASTIWAARLVTIGVPVALVAYVAVLLNGPDTWRAAAGWQYLFLAVLGGLGLVAGYISIGELQRQQAIAAANQAQEQIADDARGQEQRRAMQALTDTDPLIQWDQYVGANVPEDVRTEALRRIAKRPSLETDLTAALTNPNTLWSNEVLWLMLQLDFKPSKALEHPVRVAIANWAASLRDKSNDTAGDGDRYVDLYQPAQLDRVLDVARMMAGKAKIDLSEALDSVQRVVTEVYPTSQAAGTFPNRVAKTKLDIKALLATTAQ
jgi:hypothetical protein